MTHVEIIKDLAKKFGLGEQEIENYCILATGMQARFLNYNVIRELALEIKTGYLEYAPIEGGV